MTSPPSTEPASALGGAEAIVVPDPRRWLIFGILSVAFMMVSIDQTIVATALPALQHDLHAQLNWAGWTITGYALGRVVVLPLSGRLSDLYGSRRIFLTAVVAFTVASLGCGLVNNIYVLIVLRILQSIGGGAFLPAATGIVSRRFGADRDRAIGLFTSILPIGGVIGPILGGIFVQYWSWRGIFLVNVPIGAVVLLLARRYLPTDARAAGSQKLDARGMTLLAIVLLAGMLAITYMGNPGIGLLDTWLIVPAVIALASGVLLVVHVRRTVAPFIPPSLLHGRGLGVLGVINVVYGGTAIGLASLVPLYAVQRYGIGTLVSGTLLTARAVGMIVASVIAVWLLRRIGYRKPIVVGTIATAAGMVAMAVPPQEMGPFAWLSLGAGITGIGMGAISPASNNASLELAPDQVAAISGLRAMFRQAGAITAVSITTAILARVHDPGLTQAWVNVAFSAILLCTLPLIRWWPEHRGTW